ncbi:hypothetical protein [Pseudoalteromonas sp. Angola-7]|uniref:hypothetical protein n=1 Tax=Pseudoalteromonas sp. Angola-7 TaxID=3025336 RepID=UPI0023585EC4|nr:hypothetical protein [Pseudoalteromonas sp. Angola-7]MDC9529646.1 hypothetical protein [Pseudoalteromonas sp. Angola-7]
MEEYEEVFKDNNYCIKLYYKNINFPTLVAFSNREESYSTVRNFNREFGKNAFQKLDFNYISFVSNKNDWYQGVSRLAITRLNVVLKRMKGLVFTYGSSMGGFAALNFANHLNASYAFSFSPQASLDTCFMSQINDTRWQGESKLLLPFKSEILKGNLQNQAGIIFFDSDHIDGKHAKVILENTSLIPCDLKYSGHGSISAFNTIYGIKHFFNKFCIEHVPMDCILKEVDRVWVEGLEYLSLNDYEKFQYKLIATDYKVSQITIRNILTSLNNRKYPVEFKESIPKIVENNKALNEVLLVKLMQFC